MKTYLVTYKETEDGPLRMYITDGDCAQDAADEVRDIFHTQYILEVFVKVKHWK